MTFDHVHHTLHTTERRPSACVKVRVPRLSASVRRERRGACWGGHWWLCSGAVRAATQHARPLAAQRCARHGVSALISEAAKTLPSNRSSAQNPPVDDFTTTCRTNMSRAALLLTVLAALAARGEGVYVVSTLAEAATSGFVDAVPQALRHVSTALRRPRSTLSAGCW